MGDNKENSLAGLIGPAQSNHHQVQSTDNKQDNENVRRHDLMNKMDLGKLADAQQQDSNVQRYRTPTSSGVRLSSSTSGNTVNTTGRQHKLKQRFTVIRKLGKGTYGKVQLAINKQTGQEVAIKTIKKTKIENDQDLQRVRREIQIMSSIEHPHIIHIYEVFENKDKIVLVMQYAPGGELYEHVSQSKVLDDTEARRLFRQIATAIYYCHQNKICHRDLKLENILLDEKNNAKLADFGLSNVFDKTRQLKTFCGSPLYASPEIVQGSPYDGPEVDCWSLGVLLYTLVYGAMPFDGSNFKRLVKQISEASYFEPKQKSHASPLIRRLLCADPKKRATIIDICSDPWVNGQLQSGSPAVKKKDNNQRSLQHLHDDNKQQKSQCPASLLKVAQDMANLTPVRLDILLALTNDSVRGETSIAQGSSSHGSTKPPRPTQPSRSTSPRIRTPDATIRATQISPTCLMEVEETTSRSTSPVASYIVRNLEPENKDELSAENETPIPKIHDNANQSELMMTKNEPDEKQFETTESVLMEMGTTTPIDYTPIEDSNHQQLEMSIVNPINQVELDHTVVQDPQKDLIEVADVMTSEDRTDIAESQPLQHEVDMNYKDDEEASKHDPSEVQKMDVEVEVSQVSSEVRLEAEEDPSHESKDLQKSTEPHQPEIKAEKAPGEEAVASNVEVEEKNAQPIDNGVVEKPKKVKKRIVVVKKKKKVSKKDAGGEDQGTSKEASTTDKNDNQIKEHQTTETKGEQEKKATKKVNSRLAKPNGPGKVCIPDTFQASTKHDTERPKHTGQSESRRPSALVVDVSQKLLQQLQNLANERIDPTTPVLSGVKVSDKKDEFERRASLALAHAPILIGAVKQELNKSRGSTDLEPQRIEDEAVMKYALDLDKILQVTSVEHVHKLKPNEVINLMKPQQENLNDSSINLNQQEVEKPPEHRSDSVETIKAEEDVPTPTSSEPRVRSSLEINLATGDSRKDLSYCVPSATTDMPPPVAPSTNLGLTPITRSYKKVTFTKDGACITETGKIYSTKADDGTMRRVERKSKITHYPDPGEKAGSLHERRERQEEEEIIVYGANEERNARVWQESLHSRQSSSSLIPGAGQTHLRGKNLERLIMPSADLFGVETDGNTNINTGEDFDSSFRRRSLFSRQSQQLGRADSNSSCSSSSTDVFDDIFDDWTGAISMFKRKQPSPSGSITSSHQDRGSLIERAFARDSLLLPFGQSPFLKSRKSSGRPTTSNTVRHSSGRHHSSSLAGTPRCESAEPRAVESRDFFGRQQQPSGYSPSDRPASAFDGLSRHQAFMNTGRSSSLLHQMDPFTRSSPIDDLFQELELEHKSIRQRLAKQHKQLWKGSTPSLFQNEIHQSMGRVNSLQADDETTMLREQHSQRARSPRDPHVGSYLRPHEFELVDNSQRTRSNFQTGNSPHNPKIIHHSPISTQKIYQTCQDLGESQSSNSFLGQSTPMKTSMVHDKELASSSEHTLPPQPARKSLSRTCLRQTAKNLISSSSGTGSNRQTERQQVTNQASFIELKRTPSSSKTNQQQKLESAVTFSSSSKLVKTNSSNSSAFWEGRTSPISNSTTSCGIQVSSGGDCEQASPPYENQMVQNPFSQEENTKGENNDSRVQYWLQDSTGNLSSLSGSQSSTSAATEGKLDKHQHQSNLFINLNRSTAGPIISSNLIQQQQRQVSSLVTSQSISLNQQLASSTSTKSIKNMSQIMLRQPKTIMGQDDSHLVGESGKLVEGIQQFASSSKSKTKQMFSTQSELEESSMQALDASPTTPASATLSGNGNIFESSPKLMHDLHWMQTGPNKPFDLEHEDSFSNADLESQSTASSSLLDQLRSRGYRSMINQRMVAGQQQNECGDANETNLTISSSSVSVVKTESGIVKVKTTTSGTASTSNIIQNQLYQSGGTHNNEQLDSGEQKQLPKEEEEKEEQQNDLDSKTNEETTRLGEITDFITTKSPTTTLTQEEDDEMDPDVREAKQNIKVYLDSVKETELFLKAMQEEEENIERKRQQLFMFDNYLLNTKLNGFSRRVSNSFEQHQTKPYAVNGVDTFGSDQIRSAPVRDHLELEQRLSYQNESHQPPTSYRSQLMFTSNDHLSSKLKPAENSLESTVNSTKLETSLSYVPQEQRSVFSSSLYNLDINPSSAMSRSRGSYLTSMDNLSYNMGNSIGTHTPSTSSIQPFDHAIKTDIQAHPNYQNRFNPNQFTSPSYGTRDQFRRSRSQLGDQYNSDYKRAGGRPLSANLGSLSSNPLQGYTTESSKFGNPYFASAPTRTRRSISQVRYPTGCRFPEQTIMSEYMSAYGGQPISKSPPARHETSTDKIGCEDEEDDGMSAYRASTYIPKVVPQVVTGRKENNQIKDCKQRNSFLRNTFILDDSIARKEVEPPNRNRRISLQNFSTPSDSRDKIDQEGSGNLGRRRSLNELDGSNETGEGASRLSQLEQRIQENKKRREQLLNGQSSPTRSKSPTQSSTTMRRERNQIELKSRMFAGDNNSENVSPHSSTSSVGTPKFHRSSRLESMEARIKRRSYCVRMSDSTQDGNSSIRGFGQPKQQSLEKWRQQTTARELISSNWSSQNPLSNSDSTSGLFQRIGESNSMRVCTEQTNNGKPDKLKSLEFDKETDD